MTERDSPVTADEFHAYVDGMLPADRKAAVEQWLAAHPEDAARVAEWRDQAEAIRSRYGAVADEPVPVRLDLDRIDKIGRATFSWRATAAAAVVALAIGAASGWFAHGATTTAPTTLDVITAEALAAHKLYINEVRHPIEVRAAEKHLVPWLSKRVGTNLRVPNLEAYSLKLLGGRLLPGPIGPAALFMYESPTGERITVYCSKSKTHRQALRYQVGGEVAAMRWVESDIGFVVSGPADRERLAQIAQSAYEQMESGTPARGAMLLLSRRGS
jgi:anti-sigma factor RsiW